MMNRILRKLLNTIEVPDDLTPVTGIDAEQEVPPQSLGISAEGANAIWQSVEALYRTGTHPAVTFCLRRHGKIVFNRSLGHARGNGPQDNALTPKKLATPDTPVCLFSTSKAMTAVVMHLLAEQGLINLLDPVSYYLPEFAKHGKGNITLHQILSHRGGIPGLPVDVPLDTMWDNEQVWQLLCDARPIAVDGAQLAYHAITGGYVLGRVLEKVTGQTIQHYLDTQLRQPMGMKYFTYGIDATHRDDLALNYATGPIPRFPISWAVKRALGADIQTVEKVSNDPRFQEAVIPAGNLAGNAEEVSRFFQMMLNGGRWQEQTICAPATIKRVIQEFGTLQFDRTLLVPMRYSAGMMLGGEPFGFWGPNSGQAFGHLGLINKLCWADPQRDISVALLTTGLPIVAHHIPQLVRFILTVTRNCAPIAATKLAQTA
jgi:CubicO group peptidase (beta-lactamase class C family)